MRYGRLRRQYLRLAYEIWGDDPDELRFRFERKTFGKSHRKWRRKETFEEAIAILEQYFERTPRRS